ncbi:MAG: CPBP family glutamic-type intramembrane protease [Polyangiaceae bacterium]|nr:CPBP family glutamic-type intramembrane protease [Polyangiaceae bacterium]
MPPRRSLVAGTTRTDAVTDLALTLPLFVIYHLGVVFLPVRNAADLVTSQLTALAANNLGLYLVLTLALGSTITLGLLFFGHREKLRWESFVLVAIEGILYAMAMRTVASLIVGFLPLGPFPDAQSSIFGAVVMSVGAGFYEEIAFRVIAFGLGARLILSLDEWSPWLVYPLWALVCAVGFSLWHHLGAMGEPFALKPFLFRTICGLVFTLIYGFRGFAPAVWTHTLYDIWALT